MDRVISIDEVLDSNPIGAARWRVVGLCFLLAIIDGFDASSIGYVAPLIAVEFAFAPEALGWLYSAALIGLMLGALVGSPAADNYGRKPVIVTSTAVMGVFSVLTALADSPVELFLYRLLTGVGLGGVMPNINTLTAEFAPEHRRALLMTAMFTGFPGGTMIGGLVSASLVEAYGWEPIFLLGGFVPLLIVPALILFLPESPRYLARKAASPERLARMLNSISPGVRAQSDCRFVVSEPDLGSGIHGLFGNGRTPVTLLLWFTMFCNLLAVYALLGWMPSVLEAAGIALERAILASSLLSTGGVIGGLCIAFAVDRFGAPRVLVPSLLTASLFVFLIGQVACSFISLVSVLFIVGVTALGSQFGLNAMTTMSYGTASRATGLGWALAVGRMGAIAGPVVVGFAVGVGFSMKVMFAFGAVPLLLAALMVLLCRNYLAERSGQTAASGARRRNP